MSVFDEIFYSVAVYENQKPEFAGYYWVYAEGLTSEPWMAYYSYPQMGSENEVWIFGGGSRPVSDFTHYSNVLEMPRVKAKRGQVDAVSKTDDVTSIKRN